MAAMRVLLCGGYASIALIRCNVRRRIILRYATSDGRVAGVAGCNVEAGEAMDNLTKFFFPMLYEEGAGR